MEGPKERLQQLLDQLLAHMPPLVVGLLKGQCQLWLANQTDDDVLNMCDTLTQYLEHVRGDALGRSQGSDSPTVQTDVNLV